MTGILQALLSFFGVQTTAATYIEDVFSTWLYTGTGASQTITNGIDLSGKGGLVWMKGRSGATDHAWYDTFRGATFDIGSNLSTGQTTQATGLTAFNSNGFTIGSLAKINTSAATYASWTFREQAKFFDVVTYTGNGSNRTIAHNLGSVPGCIIVKRTDTTGDWQVYHRSLANTEYLVLNSTAAKATGTTRWNSTTPTSTVFSLGTDTTVNANGGTYVAYLFAHDAGGFGAAGTDNVISCGSFTTDGSGNATVSLGYEPQWVLVKGTGSGFGWSLFDNMRGMPVTGNSLELLASSSSAESGIGSSFFNPTATGFYTGGFSASQTYIYIAIRRGPMKTPTSGTSVFSPVTRSAVSTTVTSNINADLLIPQQRNASGLPRAWLDKLRGKLAYLDSTSTGAEYAGGTATLTDWLNTGVLYNSSAGAPANNSGTNYVDYFVTRAPGFFDVVCYTGTGANTTQTHNLAAAPELMLVKGRSGATAWQVYSASLANTEYLVLNTTAAKATGATRWNSTTPTSSVFTIGTAAEVNTNAATYVAYLFATVAGVSKVGSYTGTGALQTINCGFTAGSRFVLIKRTDSTGDWWVYDSARGISSGNDPYILLNSTAAEVTGTNYVDTTATGFQVTAAAPAGINANGGTFIFLAIA